MFGEINQHNFSESLAESLAEAENCFWETIYRKCFPSSFESMETVMDIEQQKAGVDRIITLTNGKRVLIEEKVRSDKYTYHDIALERWSAINTRRAGWVQKNLTCDYLAYVLKGIRKCYLLDFLTLRKAWLEHGRYWIKKAEKNEDGFSIIHAQNDGYITESICVPIGTLFGINAISMEIHF